tara:strand:- start:1408 stop:1620 length:213 start_codon:yes stop_codon:yes gene_type:complete
MRKIEASVNDHLQYAKLVKEFDKLDKQELKEIAIELARLALVMQPAAIRWAAHEAATNLGGIDGATTWAE